MEEEISENSYIVKTTGFEGPFSLLLNLIESRKLFVNEISLSQVTEDYISYINKLDNLSHVEISNFVVVAATLILIKSKSLLPNMNLTSEEEGEIVNLEDRLRLYEVFSKLAINVKEQFGKNIIFSPLERKMEKEIFVPDIHIDIQTMNALVSEVLEKIPKKIELQEVEVKKVISIEEMIDDLTQRIQNSMQLNFKEFTGHNGEKRAFTKEERVVVIVGFLAMLEMVRQGIVNVIQNDNFQDIIIEKETLIINEEII